MVVLVVGQLQLPWLLVEMEGVAQMAWVGQTEPTTPTQPLNLIFKVGAGVRVAELQGLAEEWAGWVVLEGRMAAGAGVAERVDTQPWLVLVALVVRVAKVQLRSYFTDEL